MKTLLAHFYVDPTAEEGVETMALADWLAVLDGFARSSVDAACILYLREPNRSARGTALRPTPADIVHRIRVLALASAPAAPAPETEPERVRCTPEAAARMLKAAGLSEVIPFRRMPRSGEEG